MVFFDTPYEMPPYRPPSEAQSVLFRVTRGCHWNQCTFCGMYRNQRFSVRDPEEVIADIKKAASLWGGVPRTVFLGDSDVLVMKTRDLVRVLKAIYAEFSDVIRVTAYTRGKTLYRKPLDELERLHQAGLTRLHVGLESGDSEVLRRIKKGLTPEEMVIGGRKAIEAGFQLSLYVIMGIGGEDRWREHALNTAEVLNQVAPHFVRLRTYIMQMGTPLAEEVERGEFKMASCLTVLYETKLLLEKLNISTLFLSDHVSNYLPLNGELPGEKGHLLAQLDLAIAELEANPHLVERCSHRGYISL